MIILCNNKAGSDFCFSWICSNLFRFRFPWPKVMCRWQSLVRSNTAWSLATFGISKMPCMDLSAEQLCWKGEDVSLRGADCRFCCYAIPIISYRFLISAYRIATIKALKLIEVISSVVLCHWSIFAEANPAWSQQAEYWQTQTQENKWVLHITSTNCRCG